MFSPLSPTRVRKGKTVTAEEAVRLIRDGDTIVVGGFLTSVVPLELILAVEKSFLEQGRPRDLTLIFTSGIGDGAEGGLNHFGHEGLLKRVICGHYGLVPKLLRLALEEKIEAYNLPQGVISHMYRNIASRSPRTISQVGLQTFVDPRLEGGKVNRSAKEDLVELMKFDGREYLAYKNPSPDVALLRGTTADTDGNVTMEKEALVLDTLDIAMAVKNSGGLVIVQVERLARRGSLPAKQVVIPGVFVDGIVQARPENHWQTGLEFYNPSFSGEIKAPLEAIPPLEMSERKIIARRAAFELKANSVVNLGIGMPEGVARVANEEQLLDYITLTAEPGVIGGLPAGGLNFGAAVNTEAIIPQPSQFDFYDGGGLDTAFLGLAQADRSGDLNVSRFGVKVAGCGGFINISQNSKEVVFLGTFTSGGLEVSVRDGRLVIEKEGRIRKFIERVEQVTFSGRYAVQKGQPVLYITERCVFRLTEKGLELTEIAPGVDLDRDVLAHMDFRPVVGDRLKEMDPRLFRPEPMGLKEDLLAVSLAHRLKYDPSQNLFFVNFEGHSVLDPGDIREIESAVTDILTPLDHKVRTVVNYDNFNIRPELVDEYTAMVKRLVDRFYTSTTRYTTSAFLKMKLGEALQKRNLAPHIYESAAEAKTALGR
ncbi:MAG: acyl CoA:acetate/3-ketoacid CoA transferase [Thermodesulfobacteriota bacterium]